MKRLSLLCASVVALALATGNAFADKPVTAHTTNQTIPIATAQPSTACPSGQTYDSTTGKCVAPADIEFGKGMQVHAHHGNVAPPPGGTTTATPPPK